MSLGSYPPCSAPSRQHSGSILGCLGSNSTLMDTLFPAHTDGDVQQHSVFLSYGLISVAVCVTFSVGQLHDQHQPVKSSKTLCSTWYWAWHINCRTCLWLCWDLPCTVPMAIRLMVSARLGFSGSRIQVLLSISSRTSQNSVRDSKTSRNWLWSWSRVLWQTRPEQVVTYNSRKFQQHWSLNFV